MQPHRPQPLDFRSKSAENVPKPGLPQPSPSPRREHFDGEIPPAMSPLDLFAAQSRMLARKLDESHENGRRVSRLPPLALTDVIAKQRSLAQSRQPAPPPAAAPTSAAPARPPPDNNTSGQIPGIQEPQFRPQSYYPRMSHVPSVGEDESVSGISAISEEEPIYETPTEYQSGMSFANPRSPPPVPPNARRYQASTHPGASPGGSVTPRNNEAHPFGFPEPRRTNSNEIAAPSLSKSHKLAPPPKSPHHQSSIRSVPVDSSDDEDNSASTAGSGFSRQRKLSSSSNVSIPASPFPPFAQAAHGRSSSGTSEYSIGGTRLPRPQYNFSRPLSRTSQPSLDMARQTSFDSRPSTDQIRPPFTLDQRQPSADGRPFLSDDGRITPVSMEAEHDDNPAPSYIYAKFSLPRGRMMSRDSKILQNQQDVPHYEWERPQIQSNVQPMTPLATPLPIFPPSPARSPRPSNEGYTPPRKLNSPIRPSFEHRPPPPRFHHSPKTSLERPFQMSPRPSQDSVSRSLRTDAESEYTESTRSGSTIKASQPAAPQHTKNKSSTDMTAEDHLAKGIALHEKGESRESTYHLRIAAKQNLPTAMLLYALACRHGWGMRPNPQEGVAWLRRAADCASHDVAMNDTSDNNGNNNTTSGGPEAVQARKTRRAQFALSIYELGQSHYNGWGIEQDRTLALRCFEIAANWGDADAMAEAGFCYAKGEGCKKDLKKAARYYRMAEGKGMSMVGNSWIWKPKYADADTPSKSTASSAAAANNGTPERAGRSTTPSNLADASGGGGSGSAKKDKGAPREKSRSRGIWGRKKSFSSSGQAPGVQ